MTEISDELKKLRLRMIGHSMVIMLMTMVAGLGLWMFLLGGFEILPGMMVNFQLPGTADGWARAHRGTPLNSLMVLGFALALPLLPISDRASKWCGEIVLWTGWANTLFYFASNFASNRGLSFGANAFGPGDFAAFLALAPAYLFGVLSMGVMGFVGYRTLIGKSNP